MGTKKVVLFLILAILVAAPAFAASASIYGGYEYTPNSNDGNGGEVGGKLEAPIYGGLGAVIDASYHTPHDHSGIGDLSGESLLGGLIYRFPLDWWLTPHIFGEAGWSWWDFERNEDMAERGIQIKTSDAFAYKAGLGFDSKQTKDGWSWFVDISFFHSDVPKDSFYEATGLPSNVGGNDDRSGRIRFGNGVWTAVTGIRKEF